MLSVKVKNLEKLNFHLNKQLMKQPSKTSFNLSKIKMISGGGLSVKYDLEAVIGAETYHSNHVEESTKQPHPDLEECFEKMAPMVAQIMGFSAAKDLAYKLEFKADAKQKEFLSKYVKEMTDKIKVTGIAISGKGEKVAAVITSIFTVDNKQKIALNSPRVLLKSSSRGFEEELEGLIEKIRDEAYEFLFNNRVANPEMFGPDDFGKSNEELDKTG